ncbi:MAG: hypothetical protein ABFE07_28455 [Armatimonadia bacterium]
MRYNPTPAAMQGAKALYREGCTDSDLDEVAGIIDRELELIRLLDNYSRLIESYVSLHRAYWNQERTPVEEVPLVVEARELLKKARGW